MAIIEFTDAGRWLALSGKTGAAAVK